MKTYNVTLTKVSEARPSYVNLLVDGKPMAEMKWEDGYVFGFYPTTNMGEAVYKNAERIINDLYYDGRGVIGATGDFQIKLSDPLLTV